MKAVAERNSIVSNSNSQKIGFISNFHPSLFKYLITSFQRHTSESGAAIFPLEAMLARAPLMECDRAATNSLARLTSIVGKMATAADSAEHRSEEVEARELDEVEVGAEAVAPPAEFSAAKARTHRTAQRQEAQTQL